MIVRDKPRFWELPFVVRGSLLPRILPQIGVVAGLSLLLVTLNQAHVVSPKAVAPLALSVIGAALAIAAAFRNSASYDRWWEGRKLLGQVIIDTRSLARQSRMYVAPVASDDASRKMALRCIAFVYVLRDFLRDEPIGDDARRFLTPDEQAAVAASRTPPNRLLDYFSADIAAALQAGGISPQLAQTLEERVANLTHAFASAERIKNTPMPFTYTLLIHRTAYAFCLLLPFGLTDLTGFWTPLLAAIASYTFFGLDAIGEDLERPFSLASVNCLPLDALARVVEVNILESLDEPDIPDLPRAEDFVLT